MVVPSCMERKTEHQLQLLTNAYHDMKRCPKLGKIPVAFWQITWQLHIIRQVASLKLTVRPWILDPWKRRFLVETKPPFLRGELLLLLFFREGTTHLTLPTLFLTTVRKVVVAESWIYPTHYQALAMKRVMVRSCFGGGWLAEQP